MSNSIEVKPLGKPKIIRVSDTKAYQVQAVDIEGHGPRLNIRQMYATKKDPTLKPGKQGITIEPENASRLASALKAALNDI